MSDSATALIEYIDGARDRLAEFQDPADMTWRNLIERAMADAYARPDRSGLARVVQLLSHLLEGQGRFEDALHEVDIALPVAEGQPGPTAGLLALKAALNVGRGETRAAADLAERAAAIAGDLTDENERLKTLALCATVSLQALKMKPVDTTGLLSRLVAAGRWQDQLFLLSWLIPAQATYGLVGEAAPHIRLMGAISKSQDAHFRTADAIAFHDWAASIAGPAASPLRLKRELHGNTLADWRIRCLELWRVVTRRDWRAAPAAIRDVELGQRRVGGNVGCADGWARLVGAAMGEAGAADGQCPPAYGATVATIGTALAAAYAVALAGSSVDARTWLDWLTRTRRAGVESALESPISARRVLALLALRAGQPTMARRHLDDAARWCSDSGMRLEARIARLQSLELKQKLFASGGENWKLADEIAGATADLSGAGIDPVPHRYVVANAWDAGSNRPRPNVLTPRESDVLKRLGEGMSYIEAGAALGVAAATVQTVAHRVYGKLGVHRRIDALREARRLELI